MLERSCEKQLLMVASTWEISLSDREKATLTKLKLKKTDFMTFDSFGEKRINGAARILEEFLHL